jgi:hypothetical protein
MWWYHRTFNHARLIFLCISPDTKICLINYLFQLNCAWHHSGTIQSIELGRPSIKQGKSLLWSRPSFEHTASFLKVDPPSPNDRTNLSELFIGLLPGPMRSTKDIVVLAANIVFASSVLILLCACSCTHAPNLPGRLDPTPPRAFSGRK